MSMIQTGRLNLSSSNPVATQGGGTSTFTQVTFPAAFPDGSEVIVVPFVQTFNGADTPGLRIADVTTVGFKIRINEIHVNGKVTSDGTHASETVGWIASTV
ncbi:hypothetical protein [Kitasatospora purpeofusca]|uniref:H-type lectin domain-containing protein n=1 Tax=Kitasatospora purpeofusca TaxID=67352 RepID=A0ABZ1U8Z4_9ACTN|nr:hypothetical protein [Kitasatospora purpeofusca]